MSEWSGLLFWPVYAYLVVSVAALLSLAARQRNRSEITVLEATARAVFPVLGLLLLPVSVGLFEAVSLDWALHRTWHALEDLLHGSAPAHALLHLANGLLLAGMLASVVRVVAWFARAHAFAGTVATHATRDQGHLPVYWLETPRSLCFTAGWLRPRIYLSRELFRQLEPVEVEAMLAHEKEHVRRRDGLIGGLLTAFYLLLPVPGARLLLHEWRRASERACDAAAAAAVGSRVTVAKAVIRVAESAHVSHPALCGSPAFTGDDDVEHRVKALLTPAQPSASQPLWLLSGVLILAAAAPALHHLAELIVHH